MLVFPNADFSGSFVFNNKNSFHLIQKTNILQIVLIIYFIFLFTTQFLNTIPRKAVICIHMISKNVKFDQLQIEQADAVFHFVVWRL